MSESWASKSQKKNVKLPGLEAKGLYQYIFKIRTSRLYRQPF